MSAFDKGFEKHFRRAIDGVMKVILYILASIIVVVIIFQLLKLIVVLKSLIFLAKTEESSKNAIVSVLNLFILIEFFRGILSYFEFDRLKLSYITDAVLVFIIREVMMAAFYHRLDLKLSLAYSLIIAALVLLRTLSIIYTPDREKVRHKK